MWLEKHECKTSAPRVSRAISLHAPVTADARRHAAAEDDSERRADRHLPMVSDITRHAGVGLHNRRAQVIFVSQLPRMEA